MWLSAYRQSVPWVSFPATPYNVPFHYTLSPSISEPGRGTLQTGATVVIITSHEEHVLHGGHLSYIRSTATEGSSNFVKVTQLIRS